MSHSLIGNADRKWLFQGLGLTIVVIILAILFSLINPKFATITNLLNVLTQASNTNILAVGMTFVIAAAGIDLSVGSLLALITVVSFELIKNGLDPILGVLLMFLMGGTLGAFTGYLISYHNAQCCYKRRNIYVRY
jgi:ribose/xylose/arabinose/galactoside ABC-type transport system permease subunit